VLVGNDTTKELVFFLFFFNRRKRQEGAMIGLLRTPLRLSQSDLILLEHQ
jgi:hypothetical protein